MLMTLMMTVMTSNNNDDDHVHRLSVGRTLLLLVAGLLLHCLANLDKILNIFPLLLSPYLNNFGLLNFLWLWKCSPAQARAWPQWRTPARCEWHKPPPSPRRKSTGYHWYHWLKHICESVILFCHSFKSPYIPQYFIMTSQPCSEGQGDDMPSHNRIQPYVHIHSRTWCNQSL